MMVTLSEGRTVEVAMVDRDSFAAAHDDGPALTAPVVAHPGFVR
jgi:hypothetical protein